MLRCGPPSQYQGRYALHDRTCHGVTIPAGSPVLVVTGAANRDPRAYDDPDRFDIGREGPLGITFGHGIHYCIGAHLARLESRVAIDEMYRAGPTSRSTSMRRRGSRCPTWPARPRVPVTV